MSYKKMQSVYIIEKDNKAIKIGFSQKAEEWIRKLTEKGDFKITNSYFTEPCSNAHKIKHEMQLKYKENRISGEWFLISFDESVDLLKSIFKQKACLSPKEYKLITPEDIEEAFSVK